MCFSSQLPQRKRRVSIAKTDSKYSRFNAVLPSIVIVIFFFSNNTVEGPRVPYVLIEEEEECFFFSFFILTVQILFAFKVIVSTSQSLTSDNEDDQRNIYTHSSRQADAGQVRSLVCYSQFSFFFFSFSQYRTVSSETFEKTFRAIPQPKSPRSGSSETFFFFLSSRFHACFALVCRNIRTVPSLCHDYFSCPRGPIHVGRTPWMEA